MAASEAALILKYFGRAVSAGSKPAQGKPSRVFSQATVASTLERLSGASKRPLPSAQAELNNDANRMLAFLQRHGPSTSAQDVPSPVLFTQSIPDSSKLPNQDFRYRNAMQTLQMLGSQDVANLSAQHAAHM